MTITLDPAELLDTDDFAVAATIGASTVNGIFDRPYGETFDLVAGSKPTFLCAESDLPSLTLGTSTAVINGDTWLIVERQPDGHGLVTLVLEGSP